MFNEHTSHDLHCVSRFWPDQFKEIIENVIFTLEKIVHPHVHCCDSKVACFSYVSTMAKPRCLGWCEINVSPAKEVVHKKALRFILFVETALWKCVLVLDYRRLAHDSLQEWSENMVDHCGAAQDFLFFIDSKPWRAFLPGTCEAAHETMRQVGDENVIFSNGALQWTL